LDTPSYTCLKTLWEEVNVGVKCSSREWQLQKLWYVLDIFPFLKLYFKRTTEYHVIQMDLQPSNARSDCLLSEIFKGVLTPAQITQQRMRNGRSVWDGEFGRIWKEMIVTYLKYYTTIGLNIRENHNDQSLGQDSNLCLSIWGRLLNHYITMSGQMA